MLVLKPTTAKLLALTQASHSCIFTQGLRGVTTIGTASNTGPVLAVTGLLFVS